MNETDYSPIKYVGNGVTKEFAFSWKAFVPSDLIVKLIDSDENEETLLLNTDYTVKIDSATGGNIVFTTAPEDIVCIERNVSDYQSTAYATSVGFQGSEIEKSFDKVSCNLQEMDYNIETFKTEFTEEINETLNRNKEDTDSQIAEFTNEVNSTISEVNKAAELIETTVASINDMYLTTLEKAQEASNSATEAQEQAATATEQAAEVTATYEEAMSEITSARSEAVNKVVELGSNLPRYNVFCVNTGNVDNSGNPSFLTLSETSETTTNDETDEETTITTYTLSTSGDFDVTTADGTIYNINKTLTYSANNIEDGTYNIFIDPVQKTIELIQNKVTAGSSFPSSASSGDFLLNVSKIPYDLQEITIITETDEESGEETITTTITKGLNLVLAGTLTISGGGVT